MSAIKANQVLNLDGDRIGSVVVDSIANMKNLNPEIEANATVELLGYYSKGDSGGGTFYWDSTSIEDDNGGTIIEATGVVDGRWIRNYSGAVNVKWFGAKGTGLSEDDDTEAIQKAIYTSEDVCFSKGTYYLGEINDSRPSVFILRELSNIIIDGNECTLKIYIDNTITNIEYHKVFDIDGCSNITIKNFKAIDDTFVSDTENNSKGAVLIWFNKQSYTHDIFLENLYTNSFRAIVHGKISDAPATVRRVRFNNLRCLDNYYGVVFPQHFLDVIGDISTDGVVRSYFVFGCTGHEIIVNSFNHIESSGDCYIKAYTVSTSNIRVRYTAESNDSTQGLVHIQHQNDGGVHINNIDIFMDTVDTTNLGTNHLRFSAFTSSGATAATTTSTFNNISISGETNASNIFFTNPSEESNITLSKGIIDLSKPNPISSIGSYNYSLTQGNGEVVKLTYRQNPTTSGISFDVLSKQSSGRFVINVKTKVQNDIYQSASSKVTFIDDILFGYVSGGTVVMSSIVSNSTPVQFNGACTLSYTVDGGYINILAVSADYNISNGAMISSIRNNFLG